MTQTDTTTPSQPTGINRATHRAVIAAMTDEGWYAGEHPEALDSEVPDGALMAVLEQLGLNNAELRTATA